MSENLTVTVMFPDGMSRRWVGDVDYSLNDTGHITIVDYALRTRVDIMGSVASFAPGAWRSVELRENAAAVKQEIAA